MIQVLEYNKADFDVVWKSELGHAVREAVTNGLPAPLLNFPDDVEVMQILTEINLSDYAVRRMFVLRVLDGLEIDIQVFSEAQIGQYNQGLKPEPEFWYKFIHIPYLFSFDVFKASVLRDAQELYDTEFTSVLLERQKFAQATSRQHKRRGLKMPSTN